MGISVVGSLNYDLVTYTGRVPNSGETIRANSFQTHVGGKGSNQTVAIAKLKDPQAQYEVRMVGNVGDDSFGRELTDMLTSHDVNISNVGVLSQVRTGVATIIVEEETGQNRILITAGANERTKYTEEQLSKIFPFGKDNNERGTNKGTRQSIVVFQQETPEPNAIMKWLKENRPSYLVVFNPSPFKPIPEKDWKLVDILVVNEIEALQIIETVYDSDTINEWKRKIGEDFIGAYKDICKILYKCFVNENGPSIVIITVGAQGVLYMSKESGNVEYKPPIKVKKVIDTTGAGDTFLGAVVTQLYQGSTLSKAVEFATKASSLTIQKHGAAESIPIFNEVSEPSH